MHLALLFAIFALNIVHPSWGQMSCPTISKTDKVPAPKMQLFQEFWASVHANNTNETFTLHEVLGLGYTAPFAYDLIRRGEGTNQSHDVSMFTDYVTREVFFYDHTMRVCITRNITTPPGHTYSIFGSGIEGGLHQINNTYDWHDTESYNYTKGNDSVVNGVPVEHFKTCILFDKNATVYNVDLYISKDYWQLPHGKSLPVMLRLATNETISEGKFSSNVYTYVFSAFNPNINSVQLKDIPEPPHGVVCEGRKYEPLIPKIPDHFSSVNEVTGTFGKTIMSTRMWYSYHDKLYRQDFTGPPIKNNVTNETIYQHEMTNIHDFHEGVMYLIDKITGSCKILPLHKLSKWSMDIETDPNNPSMIHMINPEVLKQKLHLKYTGQLLRKHRGGYMRMDTWTSDEQIVNNTGIPMKINFTYLYSTWDWRNSNNVTPVPLGIHFSIKDPRKPDLSTMTIRYSDVRKDEQLLDNPYDVDTCFTGNKRQTYCLKFPVLPDADFIIFPKEFIYKLRSAIATIGNISLARISSNVILQRSGDGKEIYAWVTMYAVPNVTHGNVTEYEKPTKLDSAIAKFKKMVLSNRFTVTFKNAKKNDTTITAFPDYFLSTEEFYAGNNTIIHTVIKGSLTNGAVAGLCIALFVLGIVIGALIIYIKEKKGSGQFGYSTQE